MKFLFPDVDVDVDVDDVDVISDCERTAGPQHGGDQLLQPAGERVEQQRYCSPSQVLAHWPRHHQEPPSFIRETDRDANKEFKY